MVNVVILGDGPEERAWASWFSARPEFEIVAAYPGLPEDPFFETPRAADLDAALATAGIDLVVVGGPLELRGEFLRRSAAEGHRIICLHPPGLDSEPYYQVSLSHAETGAIVVPDLPLRLHPGIDRLRQAIAEHSLGTFRGLRHESPAAPGEAGLIRGAFSRMVDPVRALLGEIEAVTASGDPPGEDPNVELVVQLRTRGGRRAEVRTWSGPAEPARLTLNGSEGSLTLEYDPDFGQPARLIRRALNSKVAETTELEPWDSHLAILQCLVPNAPHHPPGPFASGPTLEDGTRSSEIAEGAARSLRRGRTIELSYDPISEEATFKSIMTSAGCLLLLGSLAILPIALAGPALGFKETLYLAYLIPPLLLAFAGLQILRLGIRKDRTNPEKQNPDKPPTQTPPTP